MSLNSGQEWNGSMHAPSLSNKASQDRIEYQKNVMFDQHDLMI